MDGRKYYVNVPFMLTNCNKFMIHNGSFKYPPSGLSKITCFMVWLFVHNSFVWINTNDLNGHIFEFLKIRILQKKKGGGVPLKIIYMWHGRQGLSKVGLISSAHFTTRQNDMCPCFTQSVAIRG